MSSHGNRQIIHLSHYVFQSFPKHFNFGILAERKLNENYDVSRKRLHNLWREEKLQFKHLHSQETFIFPLTVNIKLVSSVNILQAVNFMCLWTSCIDRFASCIFSDSFFVTFNSLCTQIAVFSLSREAAELTYTIASTEKKWTAIW